MIKMCLNGFEMLEDMGGKVRMWSVNVINDIKVYKTDKPFSFVRFVLGVFCGLREMPLRPGV